MDSSRVSSLVDGLASAFEAGLDFYTKWKQKQERENHYQRDPRKISAAASKCALSTSLDLSGHRIKATYQVGFALIGPDFSVGDAACRECLSTNLARLEERVDLLRQRVVSPHSGPLHLHELFHVSEATRTKCIAALAEQYSRLAAQRAVPRELPIPRLRPSLRSQQEEQSPPPPPPPPPDQPIEFDRQTAVWSTSSGPPVFQSEPPSPPLTPKLLLLPPPDDLQSTLGSAVGGPSSSASEAGRHNINNGGAAGSRRPKNSVFSIFCPEAMALQVDPGRPVPAGARECRCGYRWDGNGSGSSSNSSSTAERDKDGAVLLKDGFRMTRRFLAKSHCDRASWQQQQADSGGGEGSGGGGGAVAAAAPGYGCVLCTSTGCAETHDTTEMLRVHINAKHTKWQMLHDRDMT